MYHSTKFPCAAHRRGEKETLDGYRISIYESSTKDYAAPKYLLLVRVAELEVYRK